MRAIHSSPLERARETAEPIARRLALSIESCEAVGEIRTGEWTGLTLKDAGHALPAARTSPSAAALEKLRPRHPEQLVGVVSHGDPLRAILMLFRGMTLDLMHRLEVGTASVSVVEFHDWGPHVLRINNTGELP